MINNKRGQGMSINTIILLVLGIFILVVLIMGFTMGWDKFGSFFSKNNVDTIQQSCSIACTTNSVYSFCSEKRELVGDNGTLKDVSCYFLANDIDNGMSKYGIAKCPDITCDVVLGNSCPAGNAGKTLQRFDKTITPPTLDQTIICS